MKKESQIQEKALVEFSIDHAYKGIMASITSSILIVSLLQAQARIWIHYYIYQSKCSPPTQLLTL